MPVKPCPCPNLAGDCDGTHDQPPDTEQLAREWAMEKYSDRPGITVDTYYTAVDSYLAGWKACEDLYEGRT